MLLLRRYNYYGNEDVISTVQLQIDSSQSARRRRAFFSSIITLQCHLLSTLVSCAGVPLTRGAEPDLKSYNYNPKM